MPEPTPTNMTAPEHQGPAALLARLISIDSANPDLGPGAGEAVIADFAGEWLTARGFEEHRLEQRQPIPGSRPRGTPRHDRARVRRSAGPARRARRAERLDGCRVDAGRGHPDHPDRGLGRQLPCARGVGVGQRVPAAGRGGPGDGSRVLRLTDRRRPDDGEAPSPPPVTPAGVCQGWASRPQRTSRSGRQPWPTRAPTAGGAERARPSEK